MTGDTGSSLVASFSGAIQASLSVILTLSYGLLAARFNLLNEKSAASVSKLCVNMFLPALVITNVGSQLDWSSAGKYVPVFLWSVVYTFISMGYGKAVEKLLGLPTWTSAACTFNNTTSLPLLLVESLAKTGFLDTIAGGDTSGAVDRAKSFFLINSMLSNGLTFAFGPKLLQEGGDEDEEEGEEDEEGAEEDVENGGADEETSLIPNRVRKPISRSYSRTRARLHDLLERLPHPVQVTLKFLGSLINAPLLGAFVAFIVGLTPFLHTALFGDPQKGGVLKAWFTSSVENIGDLFTSLQMFVVGTKLSASYDADQIAKKKKSRSGVDNDEDDEAVAGGSVPKTAVAVIFAARFVFWPLASIGLIYLLATKSLLSNDPILWFSMMLMPTGPPAIILSSLAELSGSRGDKMAVAKLLTISYAVTPVICFTVVGALKACERVLENQ